MVHTSCGRTVVSQRRLWLGRGLWGFRRARRRLSSKLNIASSGLRGLGLRREGRLRSLLGRLLRCSRLRIRFRLSNGLCSCIRRCDGPRGGLGADESEGNSWNNAPDRPTHWLRRSSGTSRRRHDSCDRVAIRKVRGVSAVLACSKIILRCQLSWSAWKLSSGAGAAERRRCDGVGVVEVQRRSGNVGKISDAKTFGRHSF